MKSNETKEQRKHVDFHEKKKLVWVEIEKKQRRRRGNREKRYQGTTNKIRKGKQNENDKIEEESVANNLFPQIQSFYLFSLLTFVIFSSFASSCFHPFNLELKFSNEFIHNPKRTHTHLLRFYAWANTMTSVKQRQRSVQTSIDNNKMREIYKISLASIVWPPVNIIYRREGEREINLAPSIDSWQNRGM